MAHYKILQIVVLKDTYLYLFKISLVTVNLMFDFPLHSPKNMTKKLEFLKDVYFLLLYLYFKLITSLTVYLKTLNTVVLVCR